MTQTLETQLTLSEYLARRSHKQRVIDSLAALRSLQSDNPDPAILTTFAGWGALTRLFSRPDAAPQWERDAADELEQLLTPEAYQAARAATLNAFYTNPVQIAAMWSFLDKIRAPRSSVLDVGCGIGHFLTFCPDSIKADLQKYVGFELDPTSFQIARSLYPRDSSIPVSLFNKAFQNFPYPTDAFDLMVGNLPFEDGTYSGFGNFQRSVALHARCLIKGLMHLKPGGYAFIITSTGLLDSRGAGDQYTDLRQYIEEQAVFLGAIRLPQETFESSYGTSCNSDLVLFQKRTLDDNRVSVPWQSLVDSHLVGHTTGQPLRYNGYFRDHPQFLLGTPIHNRTKFGDDFAVSWQEDRPLIDGITEALDLLAQTVNPELQQQSEDSTMFATVPAPAPAADATNTADTAWQDDISFTLSERGGIEIRFQVKPPEEVRTRLGKEGGFIYNSKGGDPRWWARQSHKSWTFIAQFGAELGYVIDIPQEFAHPSQEHPARVLQTSRSAVLVDLPTEMSVTPPPAPTPEPVQPETPQPIPTPIASVDSQPVSTSAQSDSIIDQLLAGADDYINQMLAAAEALIQSEESREQERAQLRAELRALCEQRCPRMCTYQEALNMSLKGLILGQGYGVELMLTAHQLQQQQAQATQPEAKK